MTKKHQNNHQGAGYLTEIRTIISGLRVVSGAYCGLLLKSYLCHGASDIARRKKRSSNIEDALLPIIAISTLIESNARCFATRMIAIIFFSKPVFLIAKRGAYVMKKYSIFKQIFDIRKERFCFHGKAFIFEQTSDISKDANSFKIGST